MYVPLYKVCWPDWTGAHGTSVLPTNLDLSDTALELQQARTKCDRDIPAETGPLSGRGLWAGGDGRVTLDAL